jgi:hypothetical protein
MLWLPAIPEADDHNLLWIRRSGLGVLRTTTDEL